VSVELQTLLVGMIVLVALGFLARRAWRTVSAARSAKSGDGCGGDCGCSH
jgi:hypothetical protein